MAQRVGLITAFALKTTVALALEVCVQAELVCSSKFTRDRQLAVLSLDAVGDRVQVQVNITVWILAKTAAVRTTQVLAA